MRGPRKTTDISDPILECEEDIEAAVNNIIEIAVGVGWSEVQVCLALAELADCRMLASQANSEITKEIQRALSYNRKRPLN